MRKFSWLFLGITLVSFSLEAVAFPYKRLKEVTDEKPSEIFKLSPHRGIRKEFQQQDPEKDLLFFTRSKSYYSKNVKTSYQQKFCFDFEKRSDIQETDRKKLCEILGSALVKFFENPEGPLERLLARGWDAFDRWRGQLIPRNPELLSAYFTIKDPQEGTVRYRLRDMQLGDVDVKGLISWTCDKKGNPQNLAMRLSKEDNELTAYLLDELALLALPG